VISSSPRAPGTGRSFRWRARCGKTCGRATRGGRYNKGDWLGRRRMHDGAAAAITAWKSSRAGAKNLRDEIRPQVEPAQAGAFVQWTSRRAPMLTHDDYARPSACCPGQPGAQIWLSRVGAYDYHRMGGPRCPCGRDRRRDHGRRERAPRCDESCYRYVYAAGSRAGDPWRFWITGVSGSLTTAVLSLDRRTRPSLPTRGSALLADGSRPIRHPLPRAFSWDGTRATFSWKLPETDAAGRHGLALRPRDPHPGGRRRPRHHRAFARLTDPTQESVLCPFPRITRSASTPACSARSSACTWAGPSRAGQRQHRAELGEVHYYVHEKLNAPLIVTDDDISGTFTFLRALPDNGNRST
jgi:hypothetical protein